MFKKTFTGLITSLGIASCYVGPVSKPNVYIDNLYTPQTALATINEVLQSNTSFKFGSLGDLTNCCANEEKFSCQREYDVPLRSYTVNDIVTFEYADIDRVECGDGNGIGCGNGTALIYRNDVNYDGFFRKANEVCFNNESNCQKFIDAITYLKRR